MQNNFLNNFTKYEKIAPPGVEMPSFEISEALRRQYKLDNLDPTDLLKAIINKGWVERGIGSKLNRQEYKDRVNLELDVICKIEAQEYFLIIWDIINYCINNDIPTGYARGSAGSSVILYLIGVTNIDPIKHELIFERFISADRVEAIEFEGKKYYLSLPDIDLDISAIGRPKVIEYLKGKYKGKFCKISTYGTQETKASLKNSGKIAGGLTEGEVNDLSSMIPVSFGKNATFEEAIKEVQQFKEWSESNPDLIKIAKKIRGLISSYGVHASGYVVSGKRLDNYMPIQLDKDGELVSSYEMNIIESLAIKVDLLGLKTLDVINGTLRELGIKYYDFLKNPEIVGFNIDNRAIYELFQETKYPKGIFQLESGTANNAMNKIKPLSIDEVSDVTSLARPGAFQFIDKYSEVKFGEKLLEHRNPILDEILNPTKGYIVYQEQIMFILNKLYQFSMRDANTLRKAIGKKIREKVEIWKDKIYERGDELKIDRTVTDFYWSGVSAAADYSFCKCLSPHTFVELDNGRMVTLFNLKIGDRVKAFDTIKKISHFVTVLNKYSSKRTLYRVELFNGIAIICSLEHRSLTKIGMLSLSDIFNLDESVQTEKGYSKIYSIKNLGERDAIDIEVDSEDHNFYAEGIVTSNSHAYAYSYLSVITAFLKNAHPQEFFLALLKNSQYESKPYSEISEIFKELSHFGIQLLQPDLIKSERDFKIEGENIRCGLSNVKGISDKGLNALKDFKNKEYPNKFEFFLQAESAKVGIGVLAALIQAGVTMCQENTSSRARFVLEAQTWNILTDREKRTFLRLGKEYNYDVLTLLKDSFAGKVTDEKSKLLIKDSRRETIIKSYSKCKEIFEKNRLYPKFCNFFYEKSLLGFNYSVKLLECFPDDTDLINTEQAAEEPIGTKVNIVGFIKETYTGKSRKGSKYMRIVVEDEYGESTFIMGERGVDSWNFEEKPLPSEGDIVYCTGIKSNDIFFLDTFENFDEKIYLKFGDLNREKRKRENEEAKENA